MKREQREVYRLLAAEVDYCICSFCKFGSYYGSPCSGGEYECDHPLEVVNNTLSEDVVCSGPGADCWAFRPSMNVELAADIVGVILAKGFTSTIWSKNKYGTYEVVGESPK